MTRTHSRPHVSDDNPYSEAQFKTLKYHPTFPERFGSIQDARTFCQGFFPWYNTEHRHDALGLLTPEVVHYGRAADVIAHRRAILEAAYAAHPERFVRKLPEPLGPPTAAWINPPTSATLTEAQHYCYLRNRVTIRDLPPYHAVCSTTWCRDEISTGWKHVGNWRLGCSLPARTRRERSHAGSA